MNGSPRSRLLRLGLAVSAGLLIVGCAPDVAPGLAPIPSPTSGLPAFPVPTAAAHPASRSGWQEYQEPADGFAIALPRTWKKVEPGSRSPTGVHQVVYSSGLLPGAQRSIQGARQAASQVRFLAVDLGSDGLSSGFVANVNVLCQPLAGPVPLAYFGEANRRALERLTQVTGPVTSEAVPLPAGDAVRLRYRLTMRRGDGLELELCLVQFLLVKDQMGYVLTFASTPARLAGYEPIFHDIARSFRWLAG